MVGDLKGRRDVAVRIFAQGREIPRRVQIADAAQREETAP